MSPRPVLSLERLSSKIIGCNKCQRLRAYCQEISHKKKREFADWEYWGQPLPGFGDPEAKLLIIGLAPAAHGGNRTGRMFCGDSSGDWLARALYETGFANQPTSISRHDGLQLKSAYITATIRCAPPKNKPLPEEIHNCAGYLEAELQILRSVEIILALGRVAYDQYVRLLGIRSIAPPFKHGAMYRVAGGPMLIASYHPSRQNTQTRRLSWRMWIGIFRKVRRLIENEGGES